MSPAVLETKSLAIGYFQRGGERRPIASGIDVRLGRGELVCLLGANGAGKSTLLRTLSGLQPPLEGDVLVDGRSVQGLTTLERARLMSVVLTDRIAGGMLTSYDIVSLGRHPHTDWRGTLSRQDHEAVRRALDAVGALDLAVRPVAELSDGERQRVMVARALAQEPKLMVLDEITAFLDLPRRVEVMRLLLELAHRNGTAVLVSTHDLDLALRTADQFWLVAGDGRVECGAPEDLVLAGVVERTFTSPNVVFDMRNGTFRMRGATAGAVAVHGDGVAAHWTTQAVERAGFHVVTNPADTTIHVHAPGADRSSWRLRRPSGEMTLPCLHALVNELRRGAGGSV